MALQNAIMAGDGRNEFGMPEQLIFQVRRANFSISVMNVLQILDFCEPTPLPNAPRYIRGMIEYDGAPVVVVDIGEKFGLAHCGASDSGRVILLQVRLNGSPVVIGLHADKVDSVAKIDVTDVHDLPTTGEDMSMDYFDGVGRHGGHMVLMINAENMFNTFDFSLTDAG